MHNIVSCEFLRTRATCDYIYLNVHYCVVFSGRVRVRIRVGIRFRVWLAVTLVLGPVRGFSLVISVLVNDTDGWLVVTHGP